jgi:hypothetical protein
MGGCNNKVLSSGNSPVSGAEGEHQGDSHLSLSGDLTSSYFGRGAVWRVVWEAVITRYFPPESHLRPEPRESTKGTNCSGP